MKKVAILAAENCVLSSIASPMDMFLQAGVLWNVAMGEQPSPLFQVDIVTCDGQPVTTFNQIPVVPSCSMRELSEIDLIIIPSQGFMFDPNTKEHEKRVIWLQEKFEEGVDLASVCAGAFTLASTGLLNGKTATTHWSMAKQFKERFPAVKLRTDLLVTDEAPLYCGGGISAELNLSLYLIEKYCGREIALQSSRCTLVEMNSKYQSPYVAFTPEKNHSDSLVLEAQKKIEEGLELGIDVADLAASANMSVRQFNRRFKAATGETVNNYLQLSRIEASKVELVNTRSTVEEISVRVGYANISFFRRIFKKNTSLTPAEYRKRFSQYSV